MSRFIAGDLALNFTLPATDGQTYALRDVARNAKVVALVFTCNHCPYAQAWEDRTHAIARDYAALGVRILAINSNDAEVSPADSWEQMIKRAHEKQFAFPYLYDESQDIARAYGAERTPEFFIFDATGRLRYHGAPDDNFEDEQAVRQQYVREALNAILADEKVLVPETRPVGCTIKWKRAQKLPINVEKR